MADVVQEWSGGDRCNRVAQGGSPERFHEERNAAVLLCMRTDVSVAVTGHDNDGRRMARGAQTLLQLKTRQTRQVDIQDKAQRKNDRSRVEVLLGGTEQQRLKAVGLQQMTQRTAKAIVVVDDCDDWPESWLSVKRRRSTRAFSSGSESEVGVAHDVAAH